MTNKIRQLAAIILVVCSASLAQAETIHFELDYALSEASITDVAEGQILNGVGTFFTDEAFFFALGDTLVFDILFDRRLQVFEFGGSLPYFSFGSSCGLLCPQPNGPFSGTWTSSIEALGGRRNIWSGPITLDWIGSNGISWGGQGIPITENQGSLTGIRWTTTLTSVREGGPVLLAGFNGVQLNADKINILPVPEPGTLALLGLGLVGMAARRRKKPL